MKAPAERNFRRAHGEGRRRRTRGPARALSWTVARARASALLLVVLRRLPRAGPRVVTTPLLRVSRISVHGNVRLSSGEVAGARRRPARDAASCASTSRRTGAGCSSRRGSRTSACAGCCRRPSRSSCPSARRSGSCRLGPQLYLVDETGTVIDEFGPQYREFDLPIVDGLVQRRAAAARRSIDAGRAELAARVIAALGARRADLPSRLSQIDVADAHDASCCSTATGAAAPRRRPVPRAAAVVPRARAGAARAGARTSTTSTCGSTIACLRAPARRGPRRRAAGIRSSGGRNEAFSGIRWRRTVDAC